MVRPISHLRAAAALWPQLSVTNFLVNTIEIFDGPNETLEPLQEIILCCSHWSNGMLEKTEDSGMSRVDSKEEDK